jgi:hypothetical protein
VPLGESGTSTASATVSPANEAFRLLASGREPVPQRVKNPRPAVPATVKVPMTEVAPGRSLATETIVVEPGATGPLALTPTGTRVSSTRTGLESVWTTVLVATQAEISKDDVALARAMVRALSREADGRCWPDLLPRA